MLLELRAEMDNGNGNLSANAFLAARVGPLRVCHGSTQSVPLSGGVPYKIASNPGSSGQALYVGVGLPLGASPAAVGFSAGEAVGSNAIPGAMTAAFSVGSGISFSAVLLPGDDLYALCATDVQLVVSQVGF